MEPPTASASVHAHGQHHNDPADILSAVGPPIDPIDGDGPRTVPDAATVAALAAAVADPTDTRVVWLTARAGRKVAAGFSDLDKLHHLVADDPDALTRRMFSVRVAPDVIAIDVDDPSLADVAASFVEICEAHQLRCVVVDSGRAGHVHLWVRPSDETLARFLCTRARELGLEVRTGNFMRPPGSANALGPVRVRGGVEHALAALAPTGAQWSVARRPEPVRAPVPRRARRSGLPRLSRAVVAVLRDGDHSPSRSHTLQRVVTGMVNAGWELDDAWELLRTTNFKGAAKLNEKLARHGDQTAYNYLAHCWRSAQDFVAAHPARVRDRDLAQALERFQLAADEQHWPTQAGSNAWMVLHRMIHIAYNGGCEYQSGEVTLTASERQLAEDASLSRHSVHRALRRLCEKGWITRLAVGAGPLGSRWRLELSGPHTRKVVPLTHPTDSQHPLGGVVVNGISMRAGHDAFRSNALGATGYRLARALLLYGPQTSAELARRTGMSQGAIARVLATRLGAVALVERLDRRWALLDSALEQVPKTHPDRDTTTPSSSTSKVAVEVLDHAAERFNTAGRSVQQRTWHARERQLYEHTRAYKLALSSRAALTGLTTKAA